MFLYIKSLTQRMLLQVLLYGDGKLIWHPNSALRLQPLINLSRSQPRWEAYTVLVDIDTPDEVR
jgi:small-conductance mechanosensitive channel